jgi:glycosyltransferase involved in cell wall biosynthesis
MRIGIDALFTARELRGIGKYTRFLVLGLAKAAPENQYVVYGPARAFPELQSHRAIEFRDPRGLPYPVWEQCMMPRWARRDRLDILHSTANTAPLLLPRSVRSVVSIHDVMYLLPAEVMPPSRVPRQYLGNIYRRAVVPRAARRADLVITVSEFSKRQIVEYLGVDASRIRVTYEGVNLLPGEGAPARETPPQCFAGRRLERPFILALGAGDPRKNTARILRAYASVRERLPQEEALVILGMRDWRTSPLRGLAQSLGINDAVFFADYVSDEDLRWFYASARCFLYPTLFEGFGFPILEAMAMGAPVITSNVSAVPEVAGAAALLVDPTSEEAIGEAVLLLLREEPLRAKLREKGRAQIRKFTWEEAVQRTLAVYEEAMGQRAAAAVPVAG